MKMRYENFRGVLVGVAAFLIIGVFHPLVKFFWDSSWGWLVFLIAGLAAIGASLRLRSVVAASICGVLAFTCFWSIHEIAEHREKVSSTQQQVRSELPAVVSSFPADTTHTNK